MNHLYYGDNLQIMRDCIPDESIDLIYLDPPFNSKRNYNVIFKELKEESMDQKQVFEDTWSNLTIHDTLHEIGERNSQLHKFIETIFSLNIDSSSAGYMATMAIRLMEMHRVLKPTGSIYLHCDPTMSHYLKIAMDLIFGKGCFRNEIAWCYKTRHFSKKHFGRKHDVILFYSKSDQWTFNWQAVTRWLSDSTVEKFKHIDKDGRKYRLCGRGIKGSPIQSAKDVDPKWEISNPELVVRDYLDEKVGIPYEDYWEIDIINQASKERLGYPTQKPMVLLERIIKASSNEGDIVLDPFCGCGTAIDAAQALNRRWIGIDIAQTAVSLIKKRLIDRYKADITKTFKVEGFPTTIESAKRLAEDDKREFQDWVIEYLIGGASNPKKSADGGMDGHALYRITDKLSLKAVIEVKGGGVSPKDISYLEDAVDKNLADIGIYATLLPPTKAMLQKANDAGYSKKMLDLGYKVRKIQILTVEDLLAGKGPDMPALQQDTYKSAKRKKIDLSETHVVEELGI